MMEDTTQVELESKIKIFLKRISLNEETISTVLGGIVVVIVGLLIVNYFKETRSTQQITQQAAQTSNEALIAAEEKFLKHTIAEGEDLSQVAANYYGNGELWTQLAQANDIDNPDLLAAGQEIKLPIIAGIIPQVGVVLSAASIEAIAEDKYVIQPGDDLAIISEKAYGTPERWLEIAQANNIIYPDYIEVGLELIIPR